ncbi:AzlD domain-containing protein [Paenibacillus pinisoli]|uniref:AzlD domain-containing protein n=1 Tax=Paenibacillus pinisoli TaxID=1276110 RepID=A0A3A6PZ32_9BACL|nr:AzlD domain-containing protein [Paenibacillus pinisoli]RJX40573.1 AzlD domain-containing protein [Paenibacillus pinisoli]
MEVRPEVLFILLGAAILTFLPRVIPLMILSRFELPEWAERWLSFVPIAVMAALIGQELFLHNGEWIPIGSNLNLLAAIPAFIVAIQTRSLLLTVVTGVLSLMLLRLWL